jgi:hypothetical protein
MNRMGAVLGACALLAISVMGRTQIATPTTAELEEAKNFVPIYRKRPPDSRPPSADPRDFNGIWSGTAGGGGGGGTATPATSAAVNTARAPGAGGGRDDCIPRFSAGAGPYPLKIFQTPEQILMVFLNNHRLRHVYIGSAPRADDQPSYAGHSVGHWEGDTLVVETTGIRISAGAATPSRLIERIRKVDNGERLEDALSDAGGTTFPTQTLNYTWRPDLTFVEDTCEGDGRASDLYSEFDLAHRLMLTGTVERLHWANPHGRFDLLVPNGKGGMDEWSLEARSIPMLVQFGWYSESLRPGEKVKVLVAPRKDGTRSGAFIYVAKEKGGLLRIGPL